MYLKRGIWIEIWIFSLNDIQKYEREFIFLVLMKFMGGFEMIRCKLLFKIHNIMNVLLEQNLQSSNNFLVWNLYKAIDISNCSKSLILNYHIQMQPYSFCGFLDRTKKTTNLMVLNFFPINFGPFL